MADSLITQLKRNAELQRLHEELNYARNMTNVDWRYGTMARMLESDIKRLAHTKHRLGMRP